LDTLFFFLSILVFALGVLFIYQFLKPYVFEKIKINKWVVLTIAIVVFVLPSIIWPTMPNLVAKYIVPGLFVIFFLWFMDLSGYIKKAPSNNGYTYNKKNKNNITIKPKAKPNRVKNNEK